MDKNFESICSSIGLTNLQGKVLIELIRLGGEASAPEIYKKIILEDKNIKRTTIYSTLEKLVHDGLIIESEQENKQKMFGLKHESPEELIKEISRPREQAIKEFEELLQKAKLESDRDTLDPLAYFSLKGKTKLLNQIDTTIKSSKKYLLIQANIPMLDQIYPKIEKKLQMDKNIHVFIQMTWNPDKNINSEQIFDKYAKLIGPRNIAKPSAFYNEVFAFVNDKELLKDLNEEKMSIVKKMKHLHFLQLLSDEGCILGVHFDSENGGGHFTRDPFTTQAYFPMFFSIFESSTNEKVDREVLKFILKDRTLNNFLLT